MVDADILRLSAMRAGLGLKFISKEDKISNILSQLSNWSGLDLVLKGGTALNRAYLKQRSRFSEDLDIDVIGNTSVEAKVEELKKRIMGLEGFDIEGPRMLHRTARFDAYYINEFGDKDRVMLEFYLSHKEVIAEKPIKPTLLVSRFLETSPAIFPCYSLEDLLGQKLVALYQRTLGKDIFDVYHALEIDIDISVLGKTLGRRLLFNHIDSNVNEFIRDLLEKRSMLMKDAANIGNSANHYIPRSLRPDWRVLISSLWERLGVLARDKKISP